jgi:hypothetical protein
LNPRVLDRIVCIGVEASQQEQVELLAFLDKSNDVFAWSTSNLVEVSRDVIEHRLQISLSARPKKQKLHKMSEGKVKEVKANVVMMRKKNGKW